jgi:hypothetical protein
VGLLALRVSRSPPLPSRDRVMDGSRCNNWTTTNIPTGGSSPAC